MKRRRTIDTLNMMSYLTSLLCNVCSKILDYCAHVDMYDAMKSKIQSYELVYFDVKGIAQCIRDAFAYSGIDFVDTRVTKPEFDEIKSSLLFGQLPMLKITSGQGRTEECFQSKAILRYVGKLGHLYPNRNPQDALSVDQWLELHSEFMNPLVLSMYPAKFGLGADVGNLDRDKYRQWCIKEHIPKYMEYLNDHLELETWFGGMESVSIADMCWMSTLTWLKEGTFDGIDNEFLKAYKYIELYMTMYENFFAYE